MLLNERSASEVKIGLIPAVRRGGGRSGRHACWLAGQVARRAGRNCWLTAWCAGRIG
jgi:hypothetical protein